MNLNDDILDADFNINPNKRSDRFKALVALIILWVGLIWTARNGLDIDANNSSVIIALFCCTILTFFNRNLGVKMTFIILLLGTFRVITFFSLSYYVRIGIAPIEFRIEIYLLILLIVHFILFPSTFLSMKKNIRNSIQRNGIQSDMGRAENRFIARFADKDSGELSKILSDENMSDEAKNAARYLLKIKKSPDGNDKIQGA